MSRPRTHRQWSKAVNALLLCLVLLASGWSTACSFACETAPATAPIPNAPAPMATMKPMAMQGHHDCCPNSSHSSPVITAPVRDTCLDAPALVSRPSEDSEQATAIAWTHAGTARPDLAVAVDQAGSIGVSGTPSQHLWPPGRHGQVKQARTSPSGFVPGITQIQI